MYTPPYHPTVGKFLLLSPDSYLPSFVGKHLCLALASRTHGDLSEKKRAHQRRANADIQKFKKQLRLHSVDIRRLRSVATLLDESILQAVPNKVILSSMDQCLTKGTSRGMARPSLLCLTRNWYIAIDASTATLRPVKESRSTSFMQFGASSERSFVKP